MSPRPVRVRLLDLVVTTVCIACVGAPLLPLVSAASGDPEKALVESGGTVDHRVLQTGVISNPLNASFGGGTSGTVEGSVQWDLYSTAKDGMKLVVTSDRSPALRDTKNAVDIPDFSNQAGPWNVGAGERRFGFTVAGAMGLERYAEGTRRQGFDGGRAVELARRGAPLATTRTTVRLRAQFGAPLAADAKPSANLEAIGVLNL